MFGAVQVALSTPGREGIIHRSSTHEKLQHVRMDRMPWFTGLSQCTWWGLYDAAVHKVTLRQLRNSTLENKLKKTPPHAGSLEVERLESPDPRLESLELRFSADGAAFRVRHETWILRWHLALDLGTSPGSPHRSA